MLPSERPIQASPDPVLFQETQARLDEIWQQCHGAWQRGELEATTICNGEPLPLEYCVTIVGRLVDQPIAPLDALERVTEELRAMSPNQYVYPRDTWHITLLGCTHRFVERSDYPPEKLAQIVDVCLRGMVGVPPLHIRLRGLGVIGAQCFVQGIPHERTLLDLRARLAQDLRAIGVEPLFYPRSLTHSTIMRITDNEPGQIQALYERISSLREVDFGEVVLTGCELVLTDILLSVQNTVVLKQIDFAARLSNNASE